MRCEPVPYTSIFRRPHHVTSGHPAFTLVELLVVIGIIGLLMGILMPALGRVRQQANAIKCASNLRQIGTAWTLYVQTNKGYSCPARLPPRAGGDPYDFGGGPQRRPRWFDVLGATLGTHPVRNTSADAGDAEQVSADVFLCPAVPDWTNARNYAYGYNYQFLGNARSRQDGRPIRFPVNVGGVRGAETVLAADSIGTAAGKPKAARTGYRSDGSHDLFALGNHGYTLDPPRLTAKSDYAEDDHRTPADRSGPDARHSGRANFAYCDGHVESVTPGDVGYVVRPDQSIAADGPGTRNNWFSGTGQDDDPPPAE